MPLCSSDAVLEKVMEIIIDGLLCVSVRRGAVLGFPWFSGNESGAFAAVEKEAGGKVAAAIQPGVFDGQAGGFGGVAKSLTVQQMEAGRDLA